MEAAVADASLYRLLLLEMAVEGSLTFVMIFFLSSLPGMCVNEAHNTEVSKQGLLF